MVGVPLAPSVLEVCQAVHEETSCDVTKGTVEGCQTAENVAYIEPRLVGNVFVNLKFQYYAKIDFTDVPISP